MTALVINENEKIMKIDKLCESLGLLSHKTYGGGDGSCGHAFTA